MKKVRALKKLFSLVLLLLCVSTSSFAASPSGTAIPPATEIVDSAGGVWTLSGGVCYRNGVQAAGTAPVFACAGIVSVLWFQWYTYVYASNGTWWRYNGNSYWTEVSGDPRGSGLSANGTTIPSATQIVDLTGGVWTLSGGTCYRNGVQAGGTAPGFDCNGINTVLWYQGYIYVYASNGAWWQYTDQWWTAVTGDPRGGSGEGGAGLVLNPAVWTLAVDKDFAKGDAPSLYTTFCSHQGDVNGPNTNNFSPQNVYWQNGALVLELESRTNTSCTGVTRPYAGGGFVLNIPAATSIAAEFEIKGAGVYGVAPYATLYPAGNVTPSCGWGAEDDFFEPNSKSLSQDIQAYHYWTPPPGCSHLFHQSFQNISDIASTYHTYSVIRDGGTEFFIDGKPSVFSNGQTTTSDDFHNYPITVQMGIGSRTDSQPNYTQLPAHIYVRHIKIWYKK